MVASTSRLAAAAVCQRGFRRARTALQPMPASAASAKTASTREAGRRAQAEERRHDDGERAVDRRQHAEGEDDAGRADAGQHAADAGGREAAARANAAPARAIATTPGNIALGASPLQNRSLQSA